MTDANARAAAGAPSGAPPGSDGPDVPGATDSVALSAAEWQFASMQRAGLYGWFCRLYAQEVPEDVYRAHFAEGSFAPFAGLAELGLAAEVQRLDAAIAALRAEQLPHLELAADFAQLFLLDGKTSALPYASAYEGKDAASPLYGAAEARMREFLAARNLTLQAGFREPADHLAVPLALMAELAQKDAAVGDIAQSAAAQAAFLRSALLDWLARFVDRCRQARPRFDVYPALAALLLGFVRADALFLEDVARSAPADAA
ncbi:molecular chaperone TorD [Thauera sp. WH-1]|uniref:molecular chaperone TorD n=1 Tax=Thauera sp. WH-1 TaxID=3398230 RepID=UPI0039FD8898